MVRIVSKLNKMDDDQTISEHGTSYSSDSVSRTSGRKQGLIVESVESQESNFTTVATLL